MKIYLAGSLFAEKDRMYNELVYNQLKEEGFEIYAPQKNLSINDKSKFADSYAIYEADKARMDWADVLVVNMDGISISPGSATEIGYMAAKGKKIIGLWTDNRNPIKTVSAAKIDALYDSAESQFAYINLFVVGAVKSNGFLVTSRDEMVEKLNLLRGELE